MITMRKRLSDERVRSILDTAFHRFNNESFILHDPISIPHAFTKMQDREISGLFAAIFAWGNRTTIIAKSRELMNLMGDEPHRFILEHKETDLKKLLDFKHRTFNATDLLYIISFLRHHYSLNESLESAFLRDTRRSDFIENALNSFNDYFFSLDDVPFRTRKHIASPAKGSTCKRLNMYLRWMVRHDNAGVDFGLWRKISPSDLICPIDVHVARVARELGLITRKQIDWETAKELTQNLKRFDEKDPVKYDFSLFALSAMRPKLSEYAG